MRGTLPRSVVLTGSIQQEQCFGGCWVQVSCELHRAGFCCSDEKWGYGQVTGSNGSISVSGLRSHLSTANNGLLGEQLFNDIFLEAPVGRVDCPQGVRQEVLGENNLIVAEIFYRFLTVISTHTGFSHSAKRPIMR